ncbi:NERD domain-containing protein [Salegentibacter maritimus]|uniref:NERD domain-containing protein n=1 Tax=Salegentibacter maritimus TaxID=2794347 RepID=A0ABS0TFP3_9FLAO|nr:NERD domain-containing protein [Salegentibacter maritimus]MBI6119870.1 NERD domain-containing protein [Salegentibacter maritimus]
MEILILLIIFLVVSGISLYFKKIILPKIKGAVGEYKVASKLKHLNKNEYIILNDILLRKGNSTSQIDHIVICKSGIIVIETKNYKGWIHGHQNSEYWTQTIYKYKKRLRNPIKQNWVHVFTIKKLLSEYNNIIYFPIIVFSGNGKLKNITSDIPVIYTNKLLRTIRKVNDSENLSFNQMKLISDKIQQHNITDKKVKKYHTKRIKDNIRAKKRNEDRKICPRCGSNLIKKKGKYGKFYGCENYPKCRFTLKINN